MVIPFFILLMGQQVGKQAKETVSNYIPGFFMNVKNLIFDSTRNTTIHLNTSLEDLEGWDRMVEDLADDEGFIDQDGDEVFVQEVAL